jgi:hypothetical protein
VIAFYDLDICPVSFDFLHFLTEAWRQNGGKPFHVAIVPGRRDGWRTEEHKPITDAEREWRLNHILYPAARLLGCTVTICESRGMGDVMWKTAGDRAWPPAVNGKRLIEHMQRPYRFGRAVEACRAGVAVPFRASSRAKQHVAKWLAETLGGNEPLVTITLRETHTPTRNSDVEAWLKAAYQLQKQYRVVIIRDTETMTEELYGQWRDVLTPCPLAACDLDIRMALYESAAMNLSRAGGPFMLCVLAGLPYLFFKLLADPYIDPTGHAHFVPTAEYMTICGLPPGGQLHNDARRRIVWKDDTLDTILDETRGSLAP